MGITSIKRITGAVNSLVQVNTSDSTAAALASGYITAQAANIYAANNGNFTWEFGDCVLLEASDGVSWCLINSLFSTLTAISGFGFLLSSALAQLGVHSALFPNPGGSATTVISDAAISASSVVLATWKSSANAVGILTVLPGARTLTVVSSGDPGASVLEYIVLAPNLALQNQGVVANRFASAGASATIVITDPLVNAGMIVNVNFQSQANTAEVYSAVAGAGIITVVASAAPGANVIEYVATTPSSVLTGLGYYAASYANAGGGTTITISNPNILANSVVVANFASQANASYIEKVTPTAGTLTILVSADPGVSVVDYQATNPSIAANGTALLSGNNLSDVASASTSLANLGGLALAGGQMTGQLLLDRGVATSTAAAATINHQLGVVTTEALTTAAATAYAFTYTNSRITAASVIIVSLQGGTNTTRGIEVRAVPGAGSATLSFFNNNVAASALNGTLIFGVTVL